MLILVAHDGSPHADKALDHAAKLARAQGGRLCVLSVIPSLVLDAELVTADQQEMVEKSLKAEAAAAAGRLAARMKEQGIDATVETRTGHPAETIVAAAAEKGADLLVVGSHGRHGVSRFLLGSVSAKVAEHAPCSVLIVK